MKFYFWSLEMFVKKCGIILSLVVSTSSSMVTANETVLQNPADPVEEFVSTGEPTDAGTEFSELTQLDSASDGTPIWDSKEDAYADVISEETVIPDDEEGDVISPRAEYCEPRNVRTVTRLSRTFDVKFRSEHVNGTSESISHDFTVKFGTSTTFGVSISVEEELKAWIFAKIKASISASAQKTWTTEYGVTTKATQKPRSTLHADFGVYKENVLWTTYRIYSNCNTSPKRTGKAWAPVSQGWKIYY